MDSDLSIYEAAWAETQGLTDHQLGELREESKLLFSLDLSEATYRMPYDILNENNDLIDRICEKFTPWTVFKDMFTSFEREIDLSQLVMKDYWSGPVNIKSHQGSFMGDAMSFIHLTLMLGAFARAASAGAKIPRPLGQSVGDDLFALNVTLDWCMRFMQLATACNCEFSKINAISIDAATFCEQYVIRISNLEDYKDLESFKDSIFNDLSFIDCIKGSTLSGKPKVKADKANPFLGHAMMMTKQVNWNPIHIVKERAPIFLWAKNYRMAVGLGIKFATLPSELGGLSIQIGDKYDYNREPFSGEILPYFEQMLDLPQREFAKYYLLLRGIFKASPKGFPYDNEWDRIKAIVSDCTLFEEAKILEELPDFMREKSRREQNTYIAMERGLISFHNLADELARYDAYQKHWEMKTQNTFMSLPAKDARQRANKALAIVKSNLEPKPPPFRSRSIKSLAALFREKLGFIYISRHDPAIIAAFKGMPLLDFDFDQI
jgi:hypothetical protein